MFNMEKIIRPMSGFFMLLVSLVCLGAAIWCFVNGGGPDGNPVQLVAGGVLIILFIFILKGIMIVNPNHARVLVFFGKYIGSVKENGLLWINPLYNSYRLSLRSQNQEGTPLKVND